MTTFRYKGQTAGGAKVSGVLRAYDEFEAADKLRESVAIITKLEAVPEKKESVLSRPVAFRVKEKELALLCSQFAIILASGLSVERCVSMVAAQTKNKYLRRMLDKVSEEVGAGYSLAQSFENNAPYMPKTFTETLRAGEQSGTLESCFQRLHAYYDRSAKTRAKIVSTLTYPVMVIIVAIVVFVIIIAVAVPAFTTAFNEIGSDLPGVTRALMAVSAFFTRWWWLVLGVLALLVIAYLTFRRTERGRAALAAWSLTRAPLRRIHSMNAAAQFAHSMATLLAAGLPLPRALEVTANVVSNYTFSLAVRQVRQDVERGRPMTESMSAIDYFPPCSPRWWAWASAPAHWRRRWTSSATTTTTRCPSPPPGCCPCWSPSSPSALRCWWWCCCWRCTCPCSPCTAVCDSLCHPPGAPPRAGCDIDQKI